MTKVRRTIIALVAAFAVIFGSLFLAAPANAGNGTGWVYNAGSYAITAGLNYNGSIATGPYVGVQPKQRIGGAGFDIDAVYVPSGRCLKITHQGYPYPLFYNPVSYGRWVKVNDLGATVWLGATNGSCPSYY